MTVRHTLPKLKPLAVVIALSAAQQGWAVCTTEYNITTQAEYDAADSALNDIQCLGQTVTWHLVPGLTVTKSLDNEISGHSLHVLGSALNRATIYDDDSPFSRVFRLDEDSSNLTLTLENIVVDGSNVGNAMTVRSTGETNALIIKNSTFQNARDGVVYIQNGKIEITDSEFINNIGVGEYSGGALIINNSDDAVISNTTFTNNEINSSGSGAALNVSDSQRVFIKNSIFNNNRMDPDIDSTTSRGSFGGAVAVYDSSVTIQGSEFKNNEGKNYGGAIGASYSSLEIIDTVFENNQVTMSANTDLNNGSTALANGGALYATLITDVAISNSTFEGNSATSKGGAIFIGNEVGYSKPGEVVISNTSFIDNVVITDALDGSTDAAGGAMFVESIETTFDGVNSPSTHLTISQSLFANNSAEKTTGALYVERGSITKIENVTFDGNEADFGASAYANWGPVFEGSYLRHSTFTDNDIAGIAATADSVIHADYVDTEDFEISHTIISGNDFGEAAIRVTESDYSAALTYSFLDDQTNTSSKAYVLDNTNLLGGGGLAVLNAELELLADNGGNTLSRHPKIGSPVIDAGNALISTAPSEDQRGGNRVNGVVDIGAVEVNLAPEVTQTTWSISQGTPFTFDLNDFINDPENDSVTFTVTNSPEWMTFNENGLVVNGIAGSEGSYAIVLSVADNFGQTADVTIFITVTAPSSGAGSGDESSGDKKGGSFGFIASILASGLLLSRRKKQ